VSTAKEGPSFWLELHLLHTAKDIDRSGQLNPHSVAAN